MQSLSPEEEKLVERSLPSFLNDAAKLLELEQRGVFRFWGAEELQAFARAVGFRVISVRDSFGLPPQAVIVVAERPQRALSL